MTKAQRYDRLMREQAQAARLLADRVQFVPITVPRSGQEYVGNINHVSGLATAAAHVGDLTTSRRLSEWVTRYRATSHRPPLPPELPEEP